MRGTLDAVHKSRMTHIQQESEEKIRKALKHRIRKHRVDLRKWEIRKRKRRRGNGEGEGE